MKTAVNVNEIKKGMYVMLPVSWYKHPFLKSEFAITSDLQIQKILESGIKEVDIDTERSTFASGDITTAQSEQLMSTMPSKSIIPDELREAISDAKLPPLEKAKAVQKHTTTLIAKLLENPSAENIRETKKGIAEVVDLVLSEDKTAYYLLSITSHDYNTYTHSVNVGFLSVSLAKAVFRKSTAHDMYELGAGFFLHDLGKVKVNPSIINKPGKLTTEEMNQMRRHPTEGYKILSDAHQSTKECRTIVMQHHERFNGKGYPKGISGDQIHIYGRICSIADVYDALTSDRPYRQKMAPFDALSLMKDEMIDHFQKDLFEQFVFLFKDN